MKRNYLESTDSTNRYIKRFLSQGEDVAVFAKRQTGGMGTKGRSFLSEAGGVYLSVLSFYQDFPAERAFELMAHAAVAVCRTCRGFGLAPEIKWCNDVLVNGRKIAGILIENTLSGGKVRASIVGIGLNVSNALDGLGGIAVNMRELLPAPPAVEAVRDLLLENFAAPSDFSDYLGFAGFLGQCVSVTEGDLQYDAVARDILPDGRLLIEERGKLRALSSAEIAIKIR